MPSIIREYHQHHRHPHHPDNARKLTPKCQRFSPLHLTNLLKFSDIKIPNFLHALFHPWKNKMKLQLQAISQNPTILLLLSLAHAYILLTKIFIHHSAFLRLVSITPTVHIFFIIPWSFPSALIRGLLSYFIVWIASFKILAYCFLAGPLVPCATSFLDFATVAIFPFKKNERPSEKSVKQFFQDAAPLAWLITVLNLYIFMAQKVQSNQSVLLFYSAVAASWLVLIKIMTGYIMVPIFDRPYLSTSLQQFWGKKWNKYSSFMLRLTVYDPARKLLNQCVVGFVPARIAATFLTLAVSGIMHELMLYYISCGKKPTWEASWYFLLQGVSLGFESLLKYLWLKVFKWCPISPIWSMLIVDGFVASSFYVFIVRPVGISGQNHC